MAARLNHCLSQLPTCALLTTAGRVGGVARRQGRIQAACDADILRQGQKWRVGRRRRAQQQSAGGTCGHCCCNVSPNACATLLPACGVLIAAPSAARRTLLWLPHLPSRAPQVACGQSDSFSSSPEQAVLLSQMGPAPALKKPEPRARPGVGRPSWRHTTVAETSSNWSPHTCGGCCPVVGAVRAWEVAGWRPGTGALQVAGPQPGCSDLPPAAGLPASRRRGTANAPQAARQPSRLTVPHLPSTRTSRRPESRLSPPTRRTGTGAALQMMPASCACVMPWSTEPLQGAWDVIGTACQQGALQPGLGCNAADGTPGVAHPESNRAFSNQPLTKCHLRSPWRVLAIPE